jgi:hypothetical protein
MQRHPPSQTDHPRIVSICSFEGGVRFFMCDLASFLNSLRASALLFEFIAAAAEALVEERPDCVSR